MGLGWGVGKRGSVETLPSRDLGCRGGRYAVGEAEPRGRGMGASLGNVICPVGVVEPWKEL